MPQIKEYSEQTSLAADDLLLIQDGTSDEAKKVTIETLKDEIAGTWQDYSETHTGVTVGSGVLVSKYMVTNKICHVFWALQMAADSSVTNNFEITLPVSAATWVQDLTEVGIAVGTVTARDTGVSNFGGYVLLGVGDLTIVDVYWHYVNTTAAPTRATQVFPFNEANGDDIGVTFSYPID